MAKETRVHRSGMQDEISDEASNPDTSVRGDEPQLMDEVCGNEKCFMILLSCVP
jgi:hypothetical protein